MPYRVRLREGPMTRSVAFVGVVLSASVLFAQDATTFKDDHAHDVFTRARLAVGAQHVEQLTSLVVRGTAKIALDDRLVEAASEIRILLPDCYMREDRVGTSVRRTGVCDGKLLTASIDNDQTSTPPKEMKAALLTAERQRLTRFLLGALTYVAPTYALTLRSSGPQLAETRPGGAYDTVGGTSVETNRLEVAGADNFGAQLLIDTSTKAPSRVDALIGKRILSMAFSDRRDVSGIKFPFRLSTSSNGKMLDDYLVQEVVVNPPLTKAQFTESGARAR